MRNPSYRFLLSACIVFVGVPAGAQKPEAIDIVRKSEDLHRLTGERTEGTMILEKLGGEKSSRQLITVAAQADDGDRMLIRFTAPASLEGTAFLSQEVAKGENEQWIFLPGFDKVRRIGSGELGDRFVGSDIFYEDMQARQVEDYEYKHVGEESIGGHECWIIESVPKAEKVKAESPYGKSQVWVRKDNYVAVKTRYFDRRLRPLKESLIEELVQVKGTVWRPNRTITTDLTRKHRTIMLVSKRQADYVAPDGTFSRHKLGK